jgi:hypothetical protein
MSISFFLTGRIYTHALPSIHTYQTIIQFETDPKLPFPVLSFPHMCVCIVIAISASNVVPLWLPAS